MQWKSGSWGWMMRLWGREKVKKGREGKKRPEVKEMLCAEQHRIRFGCEMQCKRCLPDVHHWLTSRCHWIGQADFNLNTPALCCTEPLQLTEQFFDQLAARLLSSPLASALNTSEYPRPSSTSYFIALLRTDHRAATRIRWRGRTENCSNRFASIGRWRFD